jgi:hypothetical protein
MKVTVYKKDKESYEPLTKELMKEFETIHSVSIMRRDNDFYYFYKNSHEYVNVTMFDKYFEISGEYQLTINEAFDELN